MKSTDIQFLCFSIFVDAFFQIIFDNQVGTFRSATTQFLETRAKAKEGKRRSKSWPYRSISVSFTASCKITDWEEVVDMHRLMLPS